MFKGYNSLVLLPDLVFWAGHDHNLFVGPELLDEIGVFLLWLGLSLGKSLSRLFFHVLAPGVGDFCKE